MQTKTFETTLGGKPLTAEFSDLTEQANGSVILRYGETVVLATAVMRDHPGDAPYFPLSVEFEEKFYAAGAILGSRFIRREGRPSEEAILSARIVDRTIRPLFDHRIRNEIQVVITVLAMGDDDPDVLGVISASLALAVSNIPWNGPVGAVRIGRNKDTGAVIINPTYQEREQDQLAFEVLACGKHSTINMIETAGNEVAESDIIAVLEACTAVHDTLTTFQADIVAAIGKQKRVVTFSETPEELPAFFDAQFSTQLRDTLFSGRAGKAHLYELKDAFVAAAVEHSEHISRSVAAAFFEEQIDQALHRGAIEDGVRPDGRGMDDIRPLFARAGGISPVLHGSGIFYRGATHVFSALTLGGPEAAQIIDTIESPESTKRFMHHYNFPPYSVGETGRIGGFNRRMIGHGALAEKALAPVIPPKETFPYTIRLVSETLSSNGSSSMGSVCASTLALMDGGVPISRPVAGIASGLLLQGSRYVLLTDIQGPEDEHGDMDFKVAGTRVGVTAIQMDVKVDGVPIPILAEALEKAKQARLQILAVMEAELAEPRATISPRAPKIITISIDPTQIGLVIGSGGKTINAIKEESGAEEISIEDDGTIFITGRNGTAEQAQRRIEALTKTYEIGDRMEVVVTRLAPFGAFARIDEHNEGLIHISEIAPFRLETVEGILAEGDRVPAEVVKIQEGKIGLSIKKADPEWAAAHGVVQNGPHQS